MAAYTMIRELGRGGFGVVQEVQNVSGESFARKTFSPAAYIPTNAHDKLRKRFKREVAVQAELGGHEVMPVIDMDLKCTNPWFVMPLAAKVYETQIAEDRSSGSVDIDAIADVLNALQFLHSLGYVHRDLNPKNILLHDGHWKLSDLGAVLPPTGRTVTLTEGTIIYTEQYCSPEQRNDFHRAQSSADIYSFGCILHDIFGNPPRTPYCQQTVKDYHQVGLIVEKCTEINPIRRPSISALRDFLLETLMEVGGHCKVTDQPSHEWLNKLKDIDNWTNTDHDDFARFFAQINLCERSPGHPGGWVDSASTPFLTLVPVKAFMKIVERQDGVAAAIVEKYCEWVRSTDFLFHFSDFICSRLTAIFDHGTPANKAVAFVALIELAESHNRWYVMREMLDRCGSDTPKEIARRLAIEIRTEEVDSQFRRCVKEVSFSPSLLAVDLAKFCE